LRVIPAVFLAVVSFNANGLPLEDASPRFATTTEFVWSAPTNELRPWYSVYRRLPHVFPATVISNGIVLAGLQSKGIPKPSTNRTTIWADHVEGDPMPGCFSVDTQCAQMSYFIGSSGEDYLNDDTSDEVLAKAAWSCASRLGVDRTSLATGKIESHRMDLPRLIEGIPVREAYEGFSLQFCGHGKIRSFCLTWPDLKPSKIEVTAKPSQIIECIKAFKTPLVPEGQDLDFFGRIRKVEKASKLTITRVTPYYMEGRFGETRREDSSPQFLTPVAELAATAKLETGDVAVRLFVPLLSNDATTLLNSSGP
jgi:hypothetical protein